MHYIHTKYRSVHLLVCKVIVKPTLDLQKLPNAGILLEVPHHLKLLINYHCVVDWSGYCQTKVCLIFFLLEK